MSFSEKRLTLVCGYQLSSEPSGLTGSLRTRLVTQAACQLLKRKKTDQVLLTIGKIWGNNYLPVSRVMEVQLQTDKIPIESIQSFPVARTTWQELFVLNAFATVQEDIGPISILSFSAHQPFIRHLLSQNGHQATQLFSVEETLRGDPGISTLHHSGVEESYRRYERVKLLAYRLGFGPLLEEVANSRRNRPYPDEAQRLWGVPTDIYTLPSIR
jgi:hypothetical protein